ncbi:MAG: hypothetical protein RTU63_13695 [Candidatus Thorarchaeota archaeon]
MSSVDLIDYHKNEEYPSHKGAIAGLLIVFGGFIGLGVYAVMQLYQMYLPEITAVLLLISPILADNLWLIVVALGGIFVLCMAFAIGASMAARRFGGTLIYI